MNHFCARVVSACLPGMCFLYLARSNVTEPMHLLNYMALVYTDILCMLPLSSGWNTVLFYSG